MGRRRTLDEEKTQPGAARPQAALGGGRAGRRCLDPRGRNARRLGISEATFHRWRNQYGGMKADAMKRLKELEKENTRLKKIVADQAVDIDILKEVSWGNF
jgi:transposase-like protein